MEDISPDAGDAVWYRDTGQGSATFEGGFTDAGKLTVVSKSNTCQVGAFIEGISPDAGDAVRNCDTGQTGAFFEGKISDAIDAVRNCDTRQAGAGNEGFFTNDCDWHAINDIRNNKIPRSRSVTVSDCDRVFINTIGQVLKRLR